MAIGDTNRIAVRIVEESVYGSTPAGPVMNELPITSEGMNSNLTTVTSETIRSDRNVENVKKVGGGAGGDIGFELRYTDWDQLIEGALMENWSSTIISQSVASAHYSGATIRADSSALNNVVVGQIFRTANSTTSGNDGDYRVTAVSVTGAAERKLTVAVASTGSAPTFASEAFGAATTLKGNNIRNGTTLKSYSIEKYMADTSTTQEFVGMRVGAMSLNFESQSIITGSFTFTGKSMTTGSTTVASTITSATTNDVMNSSGNVGNIWEGGQAVTNVLFQSITIELNNNAREQIQIGSDALAGVGMGRCEITGSFTAYFENNDLLDKFVAGTKTNLRLQVDDANGNTYIIDIPNIRITEATVAAGGGNADMVQELGFAAFVDDTGTYAIQIDQLPA